jgi:hypothetical protein
MRDPFISRSTGHFGRLYKWEGHEVIELNSQELIVKISLTRGAEIFELRDKRKNIDLLWHNHQDIVRNREYTPSRNTEFGNFLEGFAGGWQEVLPAAQYPVEYKGANIGGHGEAALLSWNYELIKDDATQLVIRLWVDLRLLPLRLVRTMTLQNDLLRFDEYVENFGAVEIDFQWGQHLALGGPLADPGAEVLVEQGELFEVPHYPSETYRFEVDQKGKWPAVRLTNGEQADLKVLPADDGTDGHVVLGPMQNPKVSIRNQKIGIEAVMTWDKATYPFCWIWMVWGGIKQYPLWGQARLITIEPFSSPIVSLDSAIAQGSALSIAPKGKIKSWVEFRVKQI